MTISEEDAKRIAKANADEQGRRMLQGCGWFLVMVILAFIVGSTTPHRMDLENMARPPRLERGTPGS